MTFRLTNNFFGNARGVNFADGGGVTWAFNPVTNTVTAAATGTGPSAGNPSAKVGLTAVNGTAGTFTRSDGAPALDVAVAPTWTGPHTFAPAAGTAVLVTGVSGTVGTRLTGSGGKTLSIDKIGSVVSRLQLYVGDGTTGTTDDAYIAGNSTTVHIGTVAAPDILKVNVGGTVQTSGAFAVNGATPPAQSTGYGTPTGGAKQSSFAAGAITLPNLAAAVAQLIIDLKAIGLIGT